MHALIYTALNVEFAHICIMRAITKFHKHFFLVAGMDEYHYATEFHIEDKTFTEDLTNPESSKHKELLAKLIEQVRSRSCCHNNCVNTFLGVYLLWNMLWKYCVI